jgi:hypothetical protein
MDLRPPMRLYRDRRPVGLIIGYGYETPWATGIVEHSEAGRGERSDRVAEFLRWQVEHQSELPDDDDAYDAICGAAMARHGVTQDDVDWCECGEWVIRTRDGVDHPARSLDFLGDRYIQWRW